MYIVPYETDVQDKTKYTLLLMGSDLIFERLPLDC